MATCQAPESLLDETLLTFGEGKRKLPRKPHRKTVWTWAHVGVKSRRTGKIECLECVQIGRTWYTSVEAYRRFIGRLNEV